MKKFDEFVFYDLETSGVNSARDQIVEAAFIRTDADLNIIEENTIQVKAKPDVVPNPYAFMVNRYPVEKFKSTGIPEFEAASQIRNIFLRDGVSTAVAGYNSIAFDNEFIRHLFYKNMLSPYDYEWRFGNSSIDVYKLVQMVAFAAPNLIEWRHDEAGNPSAKLTDVAEANGIDVGTAHEALSDVITTIKVAKLIKDRSPKIWDYFVSMSDKRVVKEKIELFKPIFSVASINGSDASFGAVIMPIGYSSNNANSIVCANLGSSVEPLLNLDAETLREKIFTKSEDLPFGEERVRLCQIAVNKQPMVFCIPKDEDKKNAFFERAGLNIDECRQNASLISKTEGIQNKLIEVFNTNLDPAEDVYGALYSGGFIEDKDLSLGMMAHQRSKETEGFPRLVDGDIKSMFSNRMQNPSRGGEILARAKWNNYSRQAIAGITEESRGEAIYYNAYMKKVLYSESDAFYGINDFKRDASELKLSGKLTKEDKKLISDLEDYVALIEKYSKRLLERVIEKEKEGPQLEAAPG